GERSAGLAGSRGGSLAVQPGRKATSRGTGRPPDSSGQQRDVVRSRAREPRPRQARAAARGRRSPPAAGAGGGGRSGAGNRPRGGGGGGPGGGGRAPGGGGGTVMRVNGSGTSGRVESFPPGAAGARGVKGGLRRWDRGRDAARASSGRRRASLSGCGNLVPLT